MTAPTAGQLKQGIEQEYGRINELWETVQSSPTVSDLPEGQFGQVKEHISVARDAMTQARKLLGE